MKYEETNNRDFKEMMGELTELIGVSYTSKANKNHFGTVDVHMLIEIMKLVELKKLNERLVVINEQMKYMR